MRTIYCGQLNLLHIGQEVTLCGWVNCTRNLGKFIFIDLRDREGIIQVLFDPALHSVFSIARELRNEFCLQIIGTVRQRPKQQINTNINTGEIEILATKLNILNPSAPLPIDIKKNNSEIQRLKYRYLDLRQLIMVNRLKLRARITGLTRQFMDEKDFLDIETPLLTRSTPEGARDYLVLSRIHNKKFYALPQSPQLFKQLLMIAGLDKYYQIVKCFRDEDLRSNRQPEFTQIDIEMSFMTASQVRSILEEFIRFLWKNILGIQLNPFPCMTYHEAIQRFGSDKPDLRNPIELIDIGDLIGNIYKNNDAYNSIYNRSCITAIRIPGGAQLNHHHMETYLNYAKQLGVKHCLWITINNCKNEIYGMQSPLMQSLHVQTIQNILIRTKAINSDTIFIVADTFDIVHKTLGTLRLKIGIDLNITNIKSWHPVWIIDFPMFIKNDQDKLVSMHHPFTAPKNTDINTLIENPMESIANSYDMVINGYEVGGGSVRIHNINMQKTVFNILGIKDDEQKKQFGFLLDALRYGAPPHAGFAFGLDRLTMLLAGTDNIRDIIAFPKTTSATDLMIETPQVMDF